MATIRVPSSLADEVSKLVQSERLPLQIVQDGEADLRVIRSKGRVESDETTLHAGGWIACATALAIAENLAVDPRQIGKLLDVLDIKIRNCELGCF